MEGQTVNLKITKRIKPEELDQVLSILILREGYLVVAGFGALNLQVYEIEDKNFVYYGSLKGHLTLVTNIYETSINNIILSAGEDNDVRIWDVMNLQCVTAIKSVCNGNILGLLETKDKKTITVGPTSAKIKVYNKFYEPLAVLEGHTEEVGGMIEVGNNLLITAAQDKTIRFWNLNNFTCLKDYTIKGLFKTHSNSLIYSKTADKIILSGENKVAIISTPLTKNYEKIFNNDLEENYSGQINVNIIELSEFLPTSSIFSRLTGVIELRNGNYALTALHFISNCGLFIFDKNMKIIGTENDYARHINKQCFTAINHSNGNKFIVGSHRGDLIEFEY